MARQHVPHSPVSASTVRRDLVVDLTSQDVPPAVVEDAAVVMSELVGNAVRHGSPLPDGCVDVSWELHPSQLRLEVCDGGGAAPEDVVGRGRVAPSAESGRGLAIVSLLAKDWGTTPYDDERIGVYADLDVQPRGRSDPVG
jgi:serine/threonine-protein kinase RsbW